jgi:SAM-dependent methyltransferase
MSFADPHRTVPEAARVLRPGGLLVFSMVSVFAWLTSTPEDRASRELKQPYFGLRSQDLNDPDWQTTEFQLTYGDWIRLFRASGLVIEDLLELRPGPDAVSTYIDPEDLPWSRDYPMDHIWKVRKA